MKYPIHEELIPIAQASLPANPVVLSLMSKLKALTSPCKSDGSVNVRRHRLPVDGGKKINIYVIEPKGSENKKLPGLVLFHGGAFMIPASDAHIRIAKEYAERIPCRVVYPDYRLAPKHPFPAPVEDCSAAYRWTVEQADELNIDKDRIVIGGDSAGGNLAAAVTLMTRDRGLPAPKCAMLIYPVTDRRMNTKSMQEFTDTPVWNSELSKLMWKAYLGGKKPEPLEYASPLEAVSFAGFPETYIEVAEFDSLRDEGIALHERLIAEGIVSQLYQIERACHGFELAFDSGITRTAMERRISLLRRVFGI